LEVDAALLSHPDVAEAVSFAAPDKLYGEVVNAAVVLKPDAAATTAEDILAHCKSKLAAFKVISRTAAQLISAL
jgi:acyl-coenzyme A synthetase/AMP-(fatty) acid ligase